MPIPSRALSLHRLAAELATFGARVEGDGSVMVSGVREDSRRVEPGDLFVARRGEKSDGTRFIPEAADRGAVAVLASQGVALSPAALPVVRVQDSSRAVSHAAEAVYGYPSRALRVVGITGTNGKTTTAWLTALALAGGGARVARLGTLGFAFEEERVEDTLTTPSADEVVRFVARARDAGASHFVMEVSSHALSQARVEGVHFAAAAFTNLTQDHLDYHGSMDEYGAAKARLFEELGPEVSVINTSDPFGAALAQRLSGRVVRVGGERAAVRALSKTLNDGGITARVALPSGEVLLESRLLGHHNLENLLVVLGICEALGSDVARCAAALRDAPGVPGRLERCDTEEDDIVVLVDYAHTPDALARVLDSIREVSRGTLVCVFGCGGDRDAAKRPLMGRAVGAAADRVIVTNDNPRTEDPAAIALAIEEGLRSTGRAYDVILDRAEAIRNAVMGALPGDVILIAGKGHETVQIVGNAKRPFDDRVEARRALALRRGGR